MKKVTNAVANTLELINNDSEKINSTLKEFDKKVKIALKKSKIKANLFVGGSVGKGTNLPGIHDIDIFMRFDLKKYEKEDISLLCESVLKTVFKKVIRLKGSRDYFKIILTDYEIEIIPVLYISRINQAKNITDHSPFHVNWIKKKVKSKKQLILDMKLAKQFFRGSGVYGAESWIGGFSGHATEILTIYYGSFEKLIKGISKWSEQKIIDIEKHYKNKKDIFENLSSSKTERPLIVIDPVEKDRNASAAVSSEKYSLLIEQANAFLKKPTKNYFEVKILTKKDIEKFGNKNKIFIFSAKKESEKHDVSGAKMLSHSKKISSLFKENNFEVIDSGMYWDKKNDGLIWVVVPKKDLSIIQILRGPPTYESTINIMNFKKKYTRKRIWREGYSYYVELKRKYTKPEQIVNLIKREKDLSALKLLK